MLIIHLTSTFKSPHLILHLKKAWEAAISPAKAIPMNGMMMWMAGNNVQIFSIGIVVMMMFGPLKAIMGVDEGESTAPAFIPSSSPLQFSPHSTQAPQTDRVWFFQNSALFSSIYFALVWACGNVREWVCCQRRKATGSPTYLLMSLWRPLQAARSLNDSRN